MNEGEKNLAIDNHLDSRVKKGISSDNNDLKTLKGVFKFFHQLKAKSHNLDLFPELLKKLQTQNTAYKKLLSFKCESPDSPINKYLDEVWEKRFRDLK